MNIAELNELMYDVYLRNEDVAGETLLAALSSAAENNDDPAGFNTLLEKCRTRGIDPVKALENTWQKRNQIWESLSGRSPLPQSSKRLGFTGKE